jgi:hypothetical protein
MVVDKERGRLINRRARYGLAVVRARERVAWVASLRDLKAQDRVLLRSVAKSELDDALADYGVALYDEAKYSADLRAAGES